MFREGVLSSRYFSLIEYFKNNKCSSGESHHVVPKSIGGGDEASNIVLVPVRVHFILHWLLPKILINESHIKKMKSALWLMMNASFGRKERYRFTSRHYEIVRCVHSSLMRGDSNPMKCLSVLAKRIGVKRPEQSEVATRVNNKRWSTPRNLKYEFICGDCLSIFQSSEAGRKYCSKLCAGRASVKKNGAPKRPKGIPAWNKGLPNISASSNGKMGAKKLSIKCVGRKMIKLPDGFRTWEYPSVVA